MGWKDRAEKVSGWKARAESVADEGSPLDKALKEQTGDVVTVETPTGPASFTREGKPFLSPEEVRAKMSQPNPGFTERGLEGLLSFFSGGGPLIDEAKGLEGALNINDPRDMKTKYLDAQARASRDVASATRHASPTVSVAGVDIPVLPALGAALPQVLAPNPTSVGGRILLGAEQGMQQAAGASNASLVSGEVPEYLRDVGGAGVIGGLTTAAMEPISAGIQGLIRGGARRIGDIVASRAGKDAADVAGEVASLRGELGAESQKGSRLFENTQRAAGGGVMPMGQSPLNPQVQRDAILALSEPSTARLQEKVAQRSIAEMPEQTRRILGLEHDLAEKAALAGDEAAKRTASYFEPSAMTQEILPRVERQVGNALIGGAAGLPAGVGMMAFGGGPQSLAGAVGGGATLGLSKGAITSARNAMASPLVQTDALGAFINAAQTGRQSLMTAGRAAAPVGVTSREEKERDSIDAFLSGN